MKAMVRVKYGTADVLELKEVEKPAPRDNEVLVKVRAAALNAYDWHMLTADLLAVRLMGGGLLKPKKKILGADVAGRVERVGGKITQFRPGDEVFGDIAGSGGGSLAEYACAREDLLAPKPVHLSFEEAAAVPMAAVTALQALRDNGRIQAGQSVLVNGASGGVGTFAVQIAKAFGAEVTALCSAGKADLVRSIGADHVINYEKEDFTKSGQRYDLILAVNGYHPIFAYRRALNPKGSYVVAGGSAAQLLQGFLLGPLISKTGSKKMGAMVTVMNRKDLVVMTELLEAGKVRPVIDRRYPLNEAPEAFRYLGEGHAAGKIVVTL